MKTKNVFSTLLTLAISMMVNGQTQERRADHRTLPVLGAKHSIEKTVQPQTKTPERKVYPTLVSSESPAPAAKPANPIDNNTFNYFNNSNCYNTKVFAEELLRQAETLGHVEKTLRSEAKLKEGDYKKELLRSADELQRQAELKMIQAAEIIGKLNLEKFNDLQVKYLKLVNITHASELVLEQVSTLNEEAGHEIKMAKELRQEAYAMHNTSSKLGVLSNAEEKETYALGQQEKAIGMLQEFASYTGSNLSESFAVK